MSVSLREQLSKIWRGYNEEEGVEKILALIGKCGKVGLSEEEILPKPMVEGIGTNEYEKGWNNCRDICQTKLAKAIATPTFSGGGKEKL